MIIVALLLSLLGQIAGNRKRAVLDEGVAASGEAGIARLQHELETLREEKFNLGQTVSSQQQEFTNMHQIVVQPAARIAVFEQCDKKVQALSEEDVNKASPFTPCESLDVDRQTELGEIECFARIRLGRIDWEFHCVESVVEQVKKVCATEPLSEECSTKVSDGVKEWSFPDGFRPFGYALAAEVASLMHDCQYGVNTSVKEVKDKWCKGLSEEDVKTMGVNRDQCGKHAKRIFVHQKLVMCMQDAPLYMKPKTISA